MTVQAREGPRNFRGCEGPAVFNLNLLSLETCSSDGIEHPSRQRQIVRKSTDPTDLAPPQKPISYGQDPIVRVSHNTIELHTAIQRLDKPRSRDVRGVSCRL